MGAISFEFATNGIDLDRLAATIQIQGIDNAPWPGRIQRNGNILTILRQTSDSGRMSISWPTHQGWLRIASGSLPENNEPYWGELELARGFINDLRNHVAIWLEAGLSIPAELSKQIYSATELFIDAELANDIVESAGLAVQSINDIVKATYQLSRSFARQVANIQKQYNRTLDFSFGIAGNQMIDFPLSCDFLNWFAFCPATFEADELDQFNQLARKNKKIIGPMVDVSPDGLRQFGIADSTFENQRVASLKRIDMLENCREFDFDLCHAVSGIDGIGHRQMSFPHQLQLAMDSIQHVQSFTDKPVMVSFSNPFGDQVARSLGGSFAIQIADEMLRRGAQISVFGLEINLDFLPHGDVTNQPFTWLDMLDQWAYFGIPLIILLRIPALELPIDKSSDKGWRRNPIWRSMTLDQRTEYLSVLLPLIGTRLGVQALLWNNRFTSEGEKFTAARISEEHCSNGAANHLFSIATNSFLEIFDPGK